MGKHKKKISKCKDSEKLSDLNACVVDLKDQDVDRHLAEHKTSPRTHPRQKIKLYKDGGQSEEHKKSSPTCDRQRKQFGVKSRGTPLYHDGAQHQTNVKGKKRKTRESHLTDASERESSQDIPGISSTLQREDHRDDRGTPTASKKKCREMSDLDTSGGQGDVSSSESSASEQGQSDIQRQSDIPWEQTQVEDPASTTDSAQKKFHTTEDMPHGYKVFLMSNPDHLLLILPHPQELCMRGKVQIKALVGCVEILGYQVKPSDTSFPCFSPEGTSCLSIKTVPVVDDFNQKKTRKHIRSLLQEEDLQVLKEVLTLASDRNNVTLLLSRLHCVQCDFVMSVAPFQQLFSLPPGGSTHSAKWLQHIGIQLYSEDQYGSKVQLPEAYVDAARELCEAAERGDSPILAVCGGKNVGKSTLCRYLVNCALNVAEAVAYLECDVGQTEFTPPGCISLSLVQQPILGPPFTHLRDPLSMSFLGSATPGDDPAHYVNCVHLVFEKYSSMEKKPPLIVNTMGWNKGLGVSLLVDVLSIVRPSTVIQLESDNKYKNYPAQLTFQYISSTSGWHYNQVEKDNNRPYRNMHKLRSVQSPVSKRRDQQDRFKAVDYRSMTLLAYFVKAAGVGPMLYLNSAQPYQIAWHQLAVHVCHASIPNSQVLYALNGSMVALCCAPHQQFQRRQEPGMPQFLAKTPVCQCVGFGIVRSINPETQTYYIITPVSQKQLSGVNCLLKGAVDIPGQLLLKQKSATDTVPYVGQSRDVTGARSVKARRYMKRRKYSASAESLPQI